MEMIERGLSEEQKMMRAACRAFVDDDVTRFIRGNWQREWLMAFGRRMFSSTCSRVPTRSARPGSTSGIEKLFRDGSIFPHMDATADISRLKIVKAMFPRTAGAYAGRED